MADPIPAVVIAEMGIPHLKGDPLPVSVKAAVPTIQTAQELHPSVETTAVLHRVEMKIDLDQIRKNVFASVE